MKLSWLLIFLKIERSLLSLCYETKIDTPIIYEVMDRDTIKSEILLHVPVVKRGCTLKAGSGGSVSQR